METFKENYYFLFYVFVKSYNFLCKKKRTKCESFGQKWIKNHNNKFESYTNLKKSCLCVYICNNGNTKYVVKQTVYKRKSNEYDNNCKTSTYVMHIIHIYKYVCVYIC